MGLQDGRTKGDVTARLIAQGSYTAFPGEPIVPLVIWTRDSRTLETLIHATLKYAGKRIPNSLGTEWFKTNPHEIESIEPLAKLPSVWRYVSGHDFSRAANGPFKFRL